MNHFQLRIVPPIRIIPPFVKRVEQKLKVSRFLECLESNARILSEHSLSWSRISRTCSGRMSVWFPSKRSDVSLSWSEYSFEIAFAAKVHSVGIVVIVLKMESLSLIFVFPAFKFHRKSSSRLRAPFLTNFTMQVVASIQRPYSCLRLAHSTQSVFISSIIFLINDLETKFITFFLLLDFWLQSQLFDLQSESLPTLSWVGIHCRSNIVHETTLLVFQQFFVENMHRLQLKNKRLLSHKHQRNQLPPPQNLNQKKLSNIERKNWKSSLLKISLKLEKKVNILKFLKVLHAIICFQNVWQFMTLPKIPNSMKNGQRYIFILNDLQTYFPQMWVMYW